MSNMQSYSLSELSSMIEHSINYTVPQNIWVRAEISSMQVKGGHCYFELVEKSDDNDSIFAAKMRAVCWRDNFAIISIFFQQTTGQQLRIGMQVMFQVSCTYHAVYGLSLRVEYIDPNYTLGGIIKQKEKTIQKLKDDGVFNMQSFLQLPTIVNNIAVISSVEAAGYGDFINQIYNNQHNLKFNIKLFNALMQGDNAEKSIISALEKIYLEQKYFDVVVIIRGGGATTDLSCFDNYLLSSSCAQFPLPIITGIGHQRDISIVDMVAFNSLKTPTAVAEYLINYQYSNLKYLSDLSDRLSKIASLIVLQQKHKLEKVEMKIDMLLNSYLQSNKDKLFYILKTLNQLSPENIYKKGYSLTKANGNIIKSASDISKNDIVEIEYIDGIVKTKVL